MASSLRRIGNHSCVPKWMPINWMPLSPSSISGCQKSGATSKRVGWRGRLLAWQGHWPEAESEYRQVLDHAPNDTDILCGLADVLLWQGKRDEALASLDHARDLAPTDLGILLRRARILLALGDTEKARQQYQRDPCAGSSQSGSNQGLGRSGWGEQTRTPDRG